MTTTTRRESALTAVDALTGDSLAGNERAVIDALQDVLVRDFVIQRICAEPALWRKAEHNLISVADSVQDSSEVPPLATLAAVLFWMSGDFDGALNQLMWARKFDPDYSLARLLMAVLLQGMEAQYWRDCVLALPDPLAS